MPIVVSVRGGRHTEIVSRRYGSASCLPVLIPVGGVTVAEVIGSRVGSSNVVALSTCGDGNGNSHDD